MTASLEVQAKRIASYDSWQSSNDANVNQDIMTAKIDRIGLIGGS